MTSRRPVQQRSPRLEVVQLPVGFALTPVIDELKYPEGQRRPADTTQQAEQDVLDHRQYLSGRDQSTPTSKRVHAGPPISPIAKLKSTPSCISPRPTLFISVSLKSNEIKR